MHGGGPGEPTTAHHPQTGGPRLVVLDEPTSGLDPASRRQVRAVVRAVVGAGTSVLLSSHSMVEVPPSPLPHPRWTASVTGWRCWWVAG